ncbi:Histidine kinase [Rhodovastum atsumiense]|uniref:histidine kinase n=1 Tax=Rhodovastum atsumiense TaxID=504468 RepID=A0A5M6IJ70_9PROT|nr:ATP-binding protein [Rhodovastum atsumiense]KAA5608182.1 PAS domain S-box protein [Rhodovastum atsumiense]CAH2602548.1 Histidine kinase [Rhodovastum atsumiense]
MVSALFARFRSAPPRTGGGPRLGALLVGLAMVILVPALAVGGVATWHAVEGYRAAEKDRLRDLASALAFTLDRQIVGNIAALIAYATSPAFGPDAASPDLPTLYAQARLIGEEIGAAIYLARQDGTRLLTTREPLGPKLPPVAALAMVRQVFATGRPAVGEMVVGTASHTHTYSVGVPVRDAAGRVMLVAGASTEATRLRDLLMAQKLPDTAYAVILDSRGVIVARSDGLHEKLVGQGARPANISRYASQEWGVFRGVGARGVPLVIAFHAVASAPGWTVVVAEPAASFDAAWQVPLLGLAVGGALALLLGGGLALLAARRVLLPVRCLGAHVRGVASQWRRGMPTADTAAALPPAGIGEIDDLRLGFAAAEAALRDSEERFRAMLHAVPTMAWEADASGSLTWVSDGWERYCGLPATALLGAGWLATVHPEELAEATGRWREAIRSGRGYVKRRRIRRASDGAWRWHLVHARPIHDAGGRILRWVGSVTDVHDLIEAQAALAELNRALEQRVQDEILAREAALEGAMRARQMQALGQIAGGVAHEFNNILQAVQGALALIEAHPGNAAKVGRWGAIGRGAAQRGAIITSRLLAFARQSQFSVEPIDLAAMLGELGEMLTHMLGGHVAVRVALPPDLPAIAADRSELETALLNLATNARDAMPRGGTLVIAATMTPPAEPPGVPLPPGRYVRIDVRDEGSGMDPQTLAQAIEPFFTTKEVGAGTGLGLSMVKGFAEQSGGAMAIESEAGRGTTVTLWLPVAGEEGAQACSVPSSASSSPPSRGR